jgi:hypothetical protein
MFRALFRWIARSFNRVNRTQSESSVSQAVKEAEQHRRDVETRSGGGWGT